MSKKNRTSDRRKLGRRRQYVRDLPSHLRGPSNNRFGGNQMQRMRGFRYSRPSPPSKGRQLSKVEIEQIEAEMRAKGQLNPILPKTR